MKLKTPLCLLVPVAMLASCQQETLNYENAPDKIQMANLETHIQTLASDEFMGRMPFTEGEEKTLDI
jgi:hypothetical protein